MKVYYEKCEKIIFILETENKYFYLKLTFHNWIFFFFFTKRLQYFLMDSFLQCYWYFHIAKLMLFAPFMQIYISNPMNK